MARRVGPPGPYWRKPPIGPRSLAARLTLAAFALASLAFVFGGILVEDPSDSGAAHPGKPGKIAFDSRRDGSTDVYSMNQDGSGVTRLTGDHPDDNDVEGVIDESPSWSPDGKSIVYSSTRAYTTGGGFDRDIWVMNADGSGKRNLTESLGDNEEFDPHFSFDGTKIVFSSTPDFNDFDISIMNADGTGIQNLTPGNPDRDFNPVFSVDGTRIYFDSDRAQPFTSQIYSMNLAGGDVRQLTDAGDNRDPDASPDNREITFISTRDDPVQPFDGDLYLMNTDGTNERRVAAIAGNEFRPSFSPGGLRLVFHRQPPSPPFVSATIAAIEIDGTNFGPLTAGPDQDDGRPDWQPIPYRCFGKSPTIVGSYVADTIVGTSGPDVIVSLSKNDTIKGGKGKDILCGNWQEDRIFGGAGNDILIGGPNKDELFGQGGKDRLFGGSPKTNRNKPTGKNICVGGGGDDTIEIDCNVVKSP
jgi:Tol biopolymer transport system component